MRAGTTVFAANPAADERRVYRTSFLPVSLIAALEISRTLKQSIVLG